MKTIWLSEDTHVGVEVHFDKPPSDCVLRPYEVQVDGLTYDILKAYANVHPKLQRLWDEEDRKHGWDCPKCGLRNGDSWVLCRHCRCRQP